MPDPTRDKVPFPVPVNSGLDLANPESSLPLGKLVRAFNKAPGYWGPRHGTTFVDRNSRGRGNPELDGVSAYLTGYYNTYQMDLKRKWSIDFLWKIGTLPASNSQYLFAFGDANFGSVELVISSDGVLTYWIHDDDDNAVLLPCVSEHSDGDIVHTRLTRSDGTFKAYVDTVLEDTDTTALTATTNMKVRAQVLSIGRKPVYAGVGYDDYTSGVFGGMYIRNFVDTDFTYAYSELPFPKGDDVLAAWTGELINSDAYVRDASKYNNPLECTDVVSGTRVPIVSEPVQHIKRATTLDGRVRNIVIVGGRLFAEVV